LTGSQGLKSADAASNAPGHRYGALHGWRDLSGEKAGETQLLSFPRREVFHPAPQPAVGAARTGAQHHPTLAANDASAPTRHGRYNWDGRYINEPASGREGSSLARRVLIPTGALALLAGVAFGAFYLMHTFATGPDAAVANAAAPAKTETAVAAAQIPATPAEAAPAKAAPAEAAKVNAAAGSDAKASLNEDVAGRVATPAAAVKTAAIAPAGAAVKVPAPGNARWGVADKPATAEAAQADEVATAPKVDDPQSAPVPTEAPKMAESKTDAAKSETPKKLAYASPSQASAHPVDKAVTAALPPASVSKPASASKEETLPGVNTNPLSVPAKASANEADDAGGYLSTVHTAVKLHAGPSNGSRSIGVVPSKATVHVLNCQGWCKVSYQGREGYVFKSFLGHGSAPVAQKAAPEKAAAAKTAAAPQAQAAQSAAKAAAPAPADAQALEAAAERTRMRR
jgi:hypothetical protein